MGIEKIDKNFATKRVKPEDYEWFDHTHQNVTLHGLFYDYEDKQYKRLPTEVAKKVNDGVLELHNNTAGGRLRFKTNSITIAIKVSQKFCGIMPHMPFFGQMGIGIYIDGKYTNSISALFVDIEDRKDGVICYDGVYTLPIPLRDREIHDVELYFPLYYNVSELFVGVLKGCQIIKPDDYTYTTPVLFYGSSITQGGCAGHPGNDYQGHICRALDTDFINLGFSGSARGEQVMAEYITTLPHSVFVYDYDHNAPSTQHLKDTHYAFYKTYRSVCKDTPIIFVTKPDYWTCPDEDDHIKVIKQTYKKALKEGDKNVYFINGKSFFGKDKYACTVDSCHPNDLGFILMAKKMIPVIKKVLKGDN